MIHSAEVAAVSQDGRVHIVTNHASLGFMEGIVWRDVTVETAIRATTSRASVCVR